MSSARLRGYLVLILGASALNCTVTAGNDPNEGSGEASATTGECVVGEFGCSCGGFNGCALPYVCVWETGTCGADPNCTPTGLGCLCTSDEDCGDAQVCGAERCEPAGTSSTTNTTSPGDGDGDGDTAAPPCTSNSGCGSSEVCLFGDCTAAHEVAFEMYVDTWTPTTCSDQAGVKELFWNAFGDLAPVHTSTTLGCPATWPDPAIVVPTQVWQLDIWEDDGLLGQDLEISVCIKNGLDECRSLPQSLLHSGSYVLDDPAGHLEVRFRPCGLVAEGC